MINIITEEENKRDIKFWRALAKALLEENEQMGSALLDHGLVDPRFFRDDKMCDFVGDHGHFRLYADSSVCRHIKGQEAYIADLERQVLGG